MKIPEQTIMNVVSNYFDLTIEDLKSSRRKMELVKARHIAMFFCRLFTDLTMDRIAEYFHKKDHNSVEHAIKSVNSQRKYYLSYRHELNCIKELIKDKDDNYDDIFQGNDF